MTSREQFEAWFKSDFHPDKTGPYLKEVLFFAWQAASKASEQQLAAAVAENAGLKGIVSEINNELYGQGFQVSGWHLNGALEPLDSWFTDNGWGEPETPATDAAIANIQAQGVEMYADKTEREANGYGMDSYDWRRMMKVRADAIEFAAQLRQGEKQ